MQLGNFSVSLAVKDIAKSKDFYEKLGFEVIGGEQDQGWLILKNGEVNIGLFQGMFEKNILTFNPGWDSSGKDIESFTDVRKLEEKLKEQGIEFEQSTESKEGPASFVINDPDGNPILFDQHR